MATGLWSKARPNGRADVPDSTAGRGNPSAGARDTGTPEFAEAGRLSTAVPDLGASSLPGSPRPVRASDRRIRKPKAGHQSAQASRPIPRNPSSGGSALATFTGTRQMRTPAQPIAARSQNRNIWRDIKAAQPASMAANSRRSGCMTAQPTSLSVVSPAPGFARGPATGARQPARRCGEGGPGARRLPQPGRLGSVRMSPSGSEPVNRALL